MSSVFITDLHTQLSIVTRARIDVERGALPANRPAPSWEEASAGAVLSRDLGAQSPVHFIYPSPLVPIWEPVGAYCQTSFTAGRSIIEASLDLGRRIQADFRYDATATDVTTPVAQSFTARAGVCQDFAHIMLCGLRTIGVPAAYVSGYLRTEPPPGQPRLLGADAMHAWVEIWCGEEMGWLGFDPTNGVEARDNHIILAVGRDYSDVSPVIGTLRSHGDHTLSVAVDVIEVEG